jgi:two-component system, LytTR family, response regulator
VDDETAARAELIELCERAQDLTVVGEADCGAKAIEAAALLRPDLLLLDAQLPDMTGFDVLRALRTGEPRRAILLTTNGEERSTAFAAGAIDCLTKPVSARAFSASMQRAQARLARRVPLSAGLLSEPIGGRAHRRSEATRPLFLIGEREHRLYPLDPEHIDYIEAAGNYVKYRVASIEYIARESIKRLQTALAPLGFIRIERSLLLNIRAIAYAQPIGHGTFEFTLVSGEQLSSGHAFRDTILSALPLRRRAPGYDDKSRSPSDAI